MRKWKTLIFVGFIVSVLIFQKVDAVSVDKSYPLHGKIIYVDSGHGGRDPGTNYGNILEKDINLEISLAVEKALKAQGATVYQTRTEDVDYSSQWDSKKKRGDLYRRIQMYENKKTDLYLSIHINWYADASYYGAEVLYGNVNKQNRLLAQSIMDAFKKELHSPRQIKPTDLYMYTHTQIPGVLIECGFLSNPKERKLLQESSYQKQLGEVITKGVIAYFETSKS